MPDRPFRYIDPAHLLAHRFQKNDRPPPWETVVLCFRDMPSSLALVDAFGGKPETGNALWGIDAGFGRSQVYTATVCGKPVGIVAFCIWGGPQAAILAEELACLGVKTIIGYGAVGGLTADLAQGTQIVIDNALLTDGTSRSYTDGPVRADTDLLDLAGSITRVTGATVDAIYRETPELIDDLRSQGAQAINLEVTPFYAAGKTCGVRCLWLGYVSDVLLDDWQDWFEDRSAWNETATRNCVDLVTAISR
jgi:uridine phosphorylase